VSLFLCLAGVFWNLLPVAVSIASAFPTLLPEDAPRVPFVINRGQVDSEVAFYAVTGDGTVFITREGEIHYVLGEGHEGIVLREEFLGSREEEVKGAVPGPAHVNFYAGSDRSGWLEDLPTFRSVSLGRKYDLIDISVILHPGGVEKLFIVHPGGRASDIRARLAGARALTIGESGHLLVATADRAIRFTPPRGFQIKDGKRVEVKVSYHVTGDEYGFRIGDHDASLPVVIDPLLASTYLGGASNDAAYSVAVSGRDIIVAGTVDSPDFPGLDEAVNALGDAFVVRLDPELTTVLAATYIGGSMTDGVRDIVADERVIYAAGYNNSPDFPTTPGAAYSGTELSGAFVVRLDARTLRMTAATSFHSNVFALSRGPRGGDLIIGGSTGSPAFPIVSGSRPSYQASFRGGAEVFLAVMSQDLTVVKATTLLGGEGFDLIHDLAVDDLGRPVAVGVTNSANFPVTDTAFDTSYNLEWKATHSWIDGFITRFTADLSTVEASSYLGGGFNDSITAVALDGRWIFVGGNTESADFPCGTSFGPVDGNDAFVVKLDGDLRTMSSCAVFGGSKGAAGSAEAVMDLDVHPNGSVYVTGRTNAGDYPVTEGAFHGDPEGSYFGAFLTAFTGDLSRLQASTLIHGGGEYPKALAFDPEGNVVVVGDTSAGGYPVTPGAVQENPGGRDDLVVSLFTPDLTGPHIEMVPQGMDFGEVPVNRTVSGKLTLHNRGGSDLIIRDVIFTTGPSRVFFLSNPCRLIEAFGSCSMPVTFSPEKEGGEKATVSVLSSDPFRRVLVAELSGTGIAGPSISVSSDHLVFENVNPGAVSRSRVLRVGNIGAVGLSMTALHLTGSAKEEFTLVRDTCSGAVLPPGGNCALAVRFEPKGTGVREARLAILSSDPRQPLFPIRLTGNGAAAGAFHAAPDPCDFHEVPLGSTRVKTVRFSSAADADLLIGRVTLNGFRREEFQIVRDTCSGRTIPGADASAGSPPSCQVDVSFSPVSEGLKRGDLQVTVEGPSPRTRSIVVTGAGVGAARGIWPGYWVWVAILILVPGTLLGIAVTARRRRRWIRKGR